MDPQGGWFGRVFGGAPGRVFEPRLFFLSVIDVKKVDLWINIL